MTRKTGQAHIHLYRRRQDDRFDGYNCVACGFFIPLNLRDAAANAGAMFEDEDEVSDAELRDMNDMPPRVQR